MKNKTKGKLMILGLLIAIAGVFYILTDAKVAGVIIICWFAMYLIYKYISYAVELMSED